ncbi:MAG: hypothetical protein AAGE76_01180 [Pseudomonadota bacterium]
MQLMGFDDAGTRRPGLVDAHCIRHDLSNRCADAESQKTAMRTDREVDPGGPIRIRATDTAKVNAISVAYLGEPVTLEPVDIVPTGTPAGVGKGQAPQPIWLTIECRMRCDIEGLADRHHTMAAARP